MDKVMHSLRKMHNIERFATEVYRAQIPAFPEKDITERLKAAMLNEQEHVDGLKARIEELGGTTSWLGFFFQIAGKSWGFATRFLGKMFILRADIWLERKAVTDYGDFLQKVDFDERSRALIQKNIGDEKTHVKRWEDSIVILSNLKQQRL